MTTFLQLTELGRAGMLAPMLAVLAALLLLAGWMHLRSLRIGGISVFLFLLMFADLLYLLCLDKMLRLDNAFPLGTGRFTWQTVGLWIGRLPVVLHLLLLTVSIAYCIGAWRREINSCRTEISAAAIREAFDNLPTGLCFSRINGLPLLINRSMYHLAEVVTGVPLQNANELWRELAAFTEKNGAVCVESKPLPMLRLPNGSVWRFARKELLIDQELYIQTTATDITQLYHLSAKLSKNNAVLDDQRARLRKLTEEISQITQEKEVLASKIKIHSEFGYCLLASRRFLQQEQPVEQLEPVTAMWREVVGKLEASVDDKRSLEDDTLKLLLEAAASIGCEIVFAGGLPEDTETVYLLLTAVREAATNAVRHAHADKVTVCLERHEDMLFVSITDNGEKQAAAITEGGGLRGLRRKVEESGGRMELRYGQGVELCLCLPMTGKGD